MSSAIHECSVGGYGKGCGAGHGGDLEFCLGEDGLLVSKTNNENDVKLFVKSTIKVRYK